MFEHYKNINVSYMGLQFFLSLRVWYAKDALKEIFRAKNQCF